MKSVTLCGSRRYESGIRQFAATLESTGIVVFQPHLHKGGEEWQELSPKYKNFTLIGLTRDHFHKITLGDVIYIYNQDGYCGNSTTLELGYAVALGKPVYAKEPDTTEGCRNVLFQDIIPSAEQLIEYLK